MSLPFLLEIGTEEIPDWMIPPAVENLRSLVAGFLADQKLGGSVTMADGAPRRLVVRAEGILPRQPDAEDLVTGPPAAAAFKDGRPTGAALGFAKKMGVAVEALSVESTAKGDYIACRKQTPGRPAKELLAEALPGLILKIYFPKTMYWTGGKSGPRFIRPIRWLVALLGDEIVPFEIAGVRSGDVTRGHRREGLSAITVTIGSYETALAANRVVVSSEERRKRIVEGIAALTAGKPLSVKADPALLETLVYITENPTPILGGFDPAYLTLPEEVLVTVMRHHQKYFSVADADGKLAPHFVAVMNISADPDGVVRYGNERVLRARFNDARFFWDFDQRKKLADRVEDLAHVTFQARLGSYLEKTERVEALVKELGGNLHAQRAARLAKCDLTTEMVKEFTGLQGVVGGLYARAQGELEPAARAIYDHYKPAGMDDSIPATEEGRVLALADKLDTLRGCFSIGMVPSGSKDPFALRRAAQGVVRILVEGGLPFPLTGLAAGNPELVEFLLDRVRYYFRDIRGYAYDEVNAVLAAGHDNLPGAAERLAALKAVRPTEHFEPLAASFKRIKNILRQAEFAGGAAVDPSLLEEGPERGLHGAFLAVRETASRQTYREALETIAGIRPRVDLFFDKVLVNAPDPRVRQNRLALLDSLLTSFSSIADFSEIATTSS